MCRLRPCPRPFASVNAAAFVVTPLRDRPLLLSSIPAGPQTLTRTSQPCSDGRRGALRLPPSLLPSLLPSCPPSLPHSLTQSVRPVDRGGVSCSLASCQKVRRIQSASFLFPRFRLIRSVLYTAFHDVAVSFRRWRFVFLSQL